MDINGFAFTLHIKDLHVYFRLINGQVRAVNGLNLYVRPGESVGIGGETGCGKSVAMKAVMGLLPPEAQIPPLFRWSCSRHRKVKRPG